MNIPLPNLDDHLRLLSNIKLFITLEFANRYLEVLLDEVSRANTAIIIPDETGEFTWMTFGLMDALFNFSKLMQLVFGPLWNNVVLYHLDDILVTIRD